MNGTRFDHPALPTQESTRIIGTGEMADRIRAFDWASTPLGPIESWSIGLLTIVNLTLAKPSPARMMWGPDFILIYNDAYRTFPGPRHPWALGKRASEVYAESWPVVGPLIEKTYATGETLFLDRLRVPLPTEDGMEDHYLHYSFNPIFENGKITGLFGSIFDVTSEVTAARQLRESQARASRILQSIGDAVIVTDPETRVTDMNPVAEELTGWRLAEAEGRPLAEVFCIINEWTRQPVENPAEKVKRIRKVIGLANHTVLLARDGRETSIDDSGAPIFDGGELIGIVLVFRNIEERRRAERENKRITEQLSQVLNATTDAIISIDRNWVMTYLNPKAVEVYAENREILGRTVWEMFPDALYVGSPFVKYYYRAMNEQIAGAFEAYYPAPLDLWLHVNVYPTRSGIVTYSRDMTKEKADREELELKRAEAERQRNEIESVYRTAPIGLALFDTKDYRYLRLNDRQAEFFGLPPEQILGRTLTEMAPIEGLKELFDQVVAGKPVVNYPLEGELVTHPGERRYWNVSYFPVLAGDGTVQAITAASLEVTQQRKAEQALIESEKLAVVGRLASSIAHEINNPLAAVTNLLYLAGMSDDLNAAKCYIDAAQRELARASSIANQTLRFHRQATRPLAVTAQDLLKSVVSIYQSRVMNANIRIEERYRSREEVQCFEGEIRQVLSNLINNAIDALQPGGGRLLLRSRATTEWSTGRRGLAFTVADTGIGIGPSLIGRIFEPFFTTKEETGTGLGLWVSERIVKRHHGTLRLRSSQQAGRKGAVFVMFLPFDAVTRQTGSS